MLFGIAFGVSGNRFESIATPFSFYPKHDHNGLMNLVHHPRPSPTYLPCFGAAAGICMTRFHFRRG